LEFLIAYDVGCNSVEFLLNFTQRNEIFRGHCHINGTKLLPDNYDQPNHCNLSIKSTNFADSILLKTYAMMKRPLIGVMLGFVGLALLFPFQPTFSQDRKANIACISFYNIENLFDTIDNEGVRDTEYTPAGSKQWNSERYWDKIEKIARVINDIGSEITPDGSAIIGLSEVENRLVLQDLVADSQISHRDYKIVHYDSPDRRGVDVALLYQEKYFNYLSSKPYLFVPEGRENFYSRDVLLVTGIFHGERMHILVNHWPSRSGGERSSRPLRNAAAQLNRQIVDSLMLADPNAHILVMGDFNDDPTNESMRTHLRAVWDKKKMKPGDLYNPFYDFFRRGIGTLAWRDSWNLFDMIVLSQTLLTSDMSIYTFRQAGVFNARYLVQTEGRFAGYPLRTHVGDNFLGGYSDHFPVYILLVREVSD
jgi:hypothetical protein